MTSRPADPPLGLRTRRSFLRLVGGTVVVTAAAPILAACSSAASPASTVTPTAATAAPSACPTPIPAAGSVGGDLNALEWEGYDGKGDPTWDKWWKDQGINLNIKYITTEIDPTPVLRSPAGEALDVNSWGQFDVMLGWRRGNLLSPITVEEVPALAMVYPAIRDNADYGLVCPGVYAAVPWQWGPIGLISRADKVPVDALASWEGLFDPKFKGRIVALDSPSDHLTEAAVALGLDPAKLTRDQLNGPVKDWWVRLKPNLKTFVTSTGDQANLLASGDAWISMLGWAYNLAQLADMETKANFIIPKEGTYGFIETISITPWSKHRRNALQWINALMEGETAKAIHEWTMGMSTNPAVAAMTTGDYVDQVFQGDPAKVLAQLKFNINHDDPSGPYATVEEWARVWNEIKTGA